VRFNLQFKLTGFLLQSVKIQSMQSIETALCAPTQQYRDNSMHPPGAASGNEVFVCLFERL